MENKQQLENAYNRALALEKAGKLDESAAAWREVLALDPDDHGGAAVRLASMGRGEAPPKAPPAYVETLFDQTAEVFDEVLVDDLGYCVPTLLRQCLDAASIGPVERMLDLGCGTGLAGASLGDLVGHMTGVDLSENMIALAWEREVYDELYIGEAVQFLEEEDGEPYDLVTATDVMPYIGDLAPFFTAAAAVIPAGGHLAFSTETLDEAEFDGGDWTVGPHQRFAHRCFYLVTALEQTGFALVSAEEIVVRHERGKPIAGHLVLARRR